MASARALLVLGAGHLLRGGEAGPACPGAFPIEGLGNVSLVPTGWTENDGTAEKMTVLSGRTILGKMGGRAYFASGCIAGSYDNELYLALDLRGKKFKYTTDMSGAACGCNAALYLTSMHQNNRPSECGDHYCDANDVCGESCAEIDIQEGNELAWHSTLHSSQDHSGEGTGYGGGGPGWSGPRDWPSGDYGPGGRCIDTKKPFQVEVAFPKNAQGQLAAMEVTLTQEGKGCPLSLKIGGYSGMGELDAALAAGMTPIVSYWSSGDMLWMDGKGADGQGPCFVDTPEKCGESVKFYGFSVTPPFPATTPSPILATTSPAPGMSASGGGAAPGTLSFLGGGLTVLLVEGVMMASVWAHRRYYAGGGGTTAAGLGTASSSQNLLAEAGSAPAAARVPGRAAGAK